MTLCGVAGTAIGTVINKFDPEVEQAAPVHVPVVVFVTVHAPESLKAKL